MTDHVILHLGTAYCRVLLCSVRSLNAPWALLQEADAISTLTLLPIKAADRIIVVYLRSILVQLSKMPAQKLLTLH